MSASYFILKYLRRKRKIREDTNDTKISELVTTKSKFRCRICLNDANLQIFVTKDDFDVVEAIRLYGGVQVNRYDGYPQHICESCYTFLENALSFRRTAQETEKLLQKACKTIEGVQNDDTEKELNIYRETIKVFKCKLCDLQFDTITEFRVHKNSKIHRNVRIQCPLCLRLVIGQFRYKRHLAHHTSASHLVCEICGKLYRKNNLIKHLQLHSEELPFQCQVCPYRGKFKESLKVHMRIHTGDKPYLCTQCNLRFLTRSNLNRHRLTHMKEKPYKCNECGRGFYKKRDVDEHYKADHIGVKDYSCNFCGKTFGIRSNLMKHEIQIHKRDKMVKGRMPLYLQDTYQRNSK